ncbi:MAG: DNA sulfur modification protein DndE [Pirellula sp.]|jgi:DNA sulfur modification protein DndE|nr:DNA sulfur modification protein DndE [Pirellula sp.]
MAIKQIKLASQGKDQLVRLKSKTGIQQWNILCRWAFCVSIAEDSPPSPVEIPADSNVEMTWHVFGGEYQEIYYALLKERCIRDGIDPTDDSEVNRQFRLHLHRGLGYLSTPNYIRSVADLLAVAVNSTS